MAEETIEQLRETIAACLDNLRAMLTAAEARGYERCREEAARVATEFSFDNYDGADKSPVAIAAAIRNLKP